MTAGTVTIGRTGWPVVLRPARLLLVLAALAFVPPLLGRLAPDLLNNARAGVIGTGVCFAVAALSLNLLMGYCGQISLGQFAFVGVGAFTGGLLLSPHHLGLPFLVAIPVTMGVGAAVAFVVGLPALRLRGLYLAIVTVGFAFAMYTSVFRVRAFTGGGSGIDVPRPIVNTFIFSRDADYLGILCVLLGLVWLLDRNVTRTKLGRAFQAIRGDESVAASFGVAVAQYKLLAFTLSGAIAGLAGLMYGSLNFSASVESFDFTRSLTLVIIVVVGGLGSRAGVVASALAFFVLPELASSIFGDRILGWNLIVFSGLLMLAIADQPGGFAAAVRERREHRVAKAARARDDAIDEDELPRLPDLPRPSGLAPRKLSPHLPLLSAARVSVRFGGLQAVDGASLQVWPGRIVGLIGPNGAGKTTMFNVISGLLQPDEGHIQLFGADATRLPAHRRAALGLGRTFQLIGLVKDLSVTENLLLAQHSVAAYGGVSALTGVGRAPRLERELRDRSAAAVRALGFERYADTPVKFLSHGQQRIVELGCTLVTAPDLVLLDEPSAGMAPGAAENLATRLRDIRDELGRTVLLIEHNIPLVMDVCDELYVMSAGRVIAHGDVDDVVRDPEVVTAYLGEAVGVPA